ncbi:Fic family protein [Helicobacter pylori]
MVAYNPDFLEPKQIFTEKELEKLNSLQEQMNLNYFIQSKTLNEKLGFDFIYSSAQIEGNTYTKAETLSLLEMGITAGGKKYSDALMVLNLRSAFEKIMCNEIEINRSSLHDLHSIIAKDLVQGQNLGAMRKTRIDGISGCSYVPLDSGERLYCEMEYLLDTYKKIENPFERAMYLHNNLAYLQYFEDCNKRTARTMQFISLKNDGIMPLILTQDNKEIYTQYREALVYYYETGKADLTKAFFIKNYEKMIDYFQHSNTIKQRVSPQVRAEQEKDMGRCR